MSIAEDMIDGFQCSWCGICFDGEHGYPVLCKGCYDDDPRAAKRAGIPRATLPEIGESLEKKKAKKSPVASSPST